MYKNKINDIYNFGYCKDIEVFGENMKQIGYYNTFDCRIEFIIYPKEFIDNYKLFMQPNVDILFIMDIIQSIKDKRIDADLLNKIKEDIENE